jgi:hypothetical protein
MIYNEDDIRDQLNNQTASVDTDQLWNNIRHQAPIKKSRKWLPLLFMFGLGGVMSAAIFHFFFQKPCLLNEEDWKIVVDSLTSDNTILQEQVYANVVEMQTLREEIRKANEGIQNAKRYKNHYVNKHNLFKNTPQTSDNISAINQSSITNVASPENNIAQSQTVAKGPLQQVNVEQISQIESAKIVTEKDKKELDQLISTPKIIPHQINNNWQYFVSFTSGAGFVKDKQIDKDGNHLNTDFAPLLSFTAEFGMLKKVKGRFSLGVLGNYSHMTYRLNYHSRLIENINLIDTAEISISNAGSENVIIGNVGGIKITEQKGKVYGYQRRFSIIPTIQYHSLTKGKWFLNHQLGLGLDIMIFSRNIIPSHDERSYLAQQGKGMAFKPYFRVGTNLEYTISKDLSAAFIIQCTYRNENYNFSSYSGKRSAIFPSIGLGLHFY